MLFKILFYEIIKILFYENHKKYNDFCKSLQIFFLPEILFITTHTHTHTKYKSFIKISFHCHIFSSVKKSYIRIYYNCSVILFDTINYR